MNGKMALSPLIFWVLGPLGTAKVKAGDKTANVAIDDAMGAHLRTWAFVPFVPALLRTYWIVAHEVSRVLRAVFADPGKRLLQMHGVIPNLTLA